MSYIHMHKRPFSNIFCHHMDDLGPTPSDANTDICPLCQSEPCASEILCSTCKTKTCDSCLGLSWSTSIKCPFCRSFISDPDEERKRILDSLRTEISKIYTLLTKLKTIDPNFPLEDQLVLRGETFFVIKMMVTMGFQPPADGVFEET